MMNEIICIRICHISTYTFLLSPLEPVEEADIVTGTDISTFGDEIRK